MRQFKDKTGQSWSLDLPIGAVLRAKRVSEGRFDLLNPDTLAGTLARDEAEFWELLWHLVTPQAQERSITAEQFGELLAADCLFEARRLFFEAWADFFHQLHRPDKAATVELTARHLAKAIELTKAKLAGPEMADLECLAEAQMRQALSNSFGGLRDSLESAIRAGTPGDNSTSSPPANA